MNRLTYAAPLSTLTLLCVLILVPLFSQAETSNTCQNTDTSSSTCETQADSSSATSTDDENASSTDKTDDNNDTASTTSESNETSTSTATSTEETNEGETGTSNEDNNSTSNDRDEVRISIRDTNIVVSSVIPLSQNEMVSITPTDNNPPVDVDSSSALALLVAFDEQSTDIKITDLQYYASFGSFFLNCMEVSGEELCGSWQFTVNGSYASVGLDQYLLHDEDSVFLFYGSPRIVEAPSEVTVQTEFTATAMQYNPENDAYSPLSGYTIGIIQDNPDNPWSPIEIATQKAAKDGTATFSLETVGEYKMGLQEDFYFPTIPLTVAAVKAHTHSNGGGSSNTSSEKVFDREGALSFIVSKQTEEGSFGAPLYNDWAAIALAAGGNSTALENVRSYLKNTPMASTHATDHERRAIALMSVGLSPYDGTGINYIEKIVDAFDGTQIGNIHEINDDIFGLLALRGAGYVESDPIIATLMAHIIQSQNQNGSWGASVDMTSAGIQALASFTNDAAITARAKARAFLKANQKDDGGFGNSFGTSWVLMAIAALGETPENWTKKGISPLDYLATLQMDDGGMENTSTTDTNRLWATSYAVSGAYGLTWLDIMDSFGKPTVLGMNVNTEKDDTEVPTGTQASHNTVIQNNSTQKNNAFLFLSDLPATIDTESANTVSESDDDSTPPSNNELVESNDKNSFFTRFFSKIGSYIFFWK